MSIFNRVFRPKLHDELVKTQAIKALGEPKLSLKKSVGAYSYDSYSQGATISTRSLGALISMYNKQPLFRSIVNVIAEQIAANSFYVGIKKTGKNKVKAIKTNLDIMDLKPRNKAIEIYKKEGLFQDLPEHPLQILLNKPNRFMSGFEFRKVINIYLDIPGEVFILKSYKEGTNIVNGLYPLPPNWITSTPTQGNPYFRTSSNMGELSEKDVIWLKEIDPLNPYSRGVGAGYSLADELDTAEYAAELMKVAFQNKGMPSAIVSLEGATPDEAQRFKASWDNSFRGANKYGLTKFTGSKIDIKQINRSFEELKVIEVKKDIRDTIKQVYGVPPEIVGIVDNSNRATIEAATYIMALYVIIPRLERSVRFINNELIPLYDDRLVVYYSDPTPDNRELQLEAAKAAPWSLTVNQWQGLSGFKGYGQQGEIRYVPVNLIPTPVIPERVQEVKEPKTKAINSSIGKAFTQADIEIVVNSLRFELLSIPTTPIVQECINTFGADEYNTLLPDEKRLKTFNQYDPTVVEYIQNYSSNKVKGINDTTKDYLRDTLEEGVVRGEGSVELRNRIIDTFTEGSLAVDAVRASRIAQTEINAAANFGHYSGMSQSGVISQRQWYPTMVHTRKWHQVYILAAIDKPFIIDGEKLMYPGDSSFGASPKNVVNCACTTLALVSGKAITDQARLKEVGDNWNDKLKNWLTQYEKAIAPGFDQQLDDCLRVFDRLI